MNEGRKRISGGCMSVPAGAVGGVSAGSDIWVGPWELEGWDKWKRERSLPERDGGGARQQRGWQELTPGMGSLVGSHGHHGLSGTWQTP